MKELMQTEDFSIVYGNFRGKDNEELFRCPRSLDDKDLRRYINDHRCCLKFEADTDHTTDIHHVQGKKCIGYYRMYFRDGAWHGRWLLDDERDQEKLTRLVCYGVNEIIKYLAFHFPHGCDMKMKNFFSDYPVWGSENRYLVQPLFSEHYKVMVDTTYSNGDYPVRIYVYEKGV